MRHLNSCFGTGPLSKCSPVHLFAHFDESQGERSLARGETLEPMVASTQGFDKGWACATVNTCKQKRYLNFRKRVLRGRITIVRAAS